jgi:hypothetical protein
MASCCIQTKQTREDEPRGCSQTKLEMIGHVAVAKPKPGMMDYVDAPEPEREGAGEECRHAAYLLQAQAPDHSSTINH